MNIRGSFAIILFVATLFLAAPLFADSASFGTFTNTLGDLGPTDTFTSGSFSVTATGYSAPGITTDLYAKNEGTNEMGMGIASGFEHEISNASFIQLNMQQIFGTNPSSVVLGIDSIQGHESYQVWGSNTAGALGTMIATKQQGFTFDLSSLSQYKYISIASPDGSVLIDGLFINEPASGVITGSGIPEPGSASLLLIGLGALAGIVIVAKGR